MQDAKPIDPERQSRSSGANPGSGTFPRLHRRTKQTNEARYAIADAVNVAAHLHDLTYAEILYILGQELSAWSSLAIRQERQDTPLAQPQTPEATEPTLREKEKS